MKLAGLREVAKQALKFTKALPLPAKVAVGGIFVAGVAIGALLGGDKFERENKETQQQEVQADTTAVEKPIVEEKKFKYVPPKIGENGIVKADTIGRYVRGNEPADIAYINDAGEVVESYRLDMDGNIEFYKKHDSDGGHIAYDINGDMISNKFFNDDGSYSESGKHFLVDTWMKNSYDRNHRLIEEDVIDYDYIANEWKATDFMKRYYKYNNDGTVTKTLKRGDNPISAEVVKDDRLLKKKEYNKDGTLKFTITPKYNNEGDLVKRDTVWNTPKVR